MNNSLKKAMATIDQEMEKELAQDFSAPTIVEDPVIAEHPMKKAIEEEKVVQYALPSIQISDLIETTKNDLRHRKDELRKLLAAKTVKTQAIKDQMAEQLSIIDEHLKFHQKQLEELIRQREITQSKEKDLLAQSDEYFVKEIAAAERMVAALEQMTDNLLPK